MRVCRPSVVGGLSSVGRSLGGDKREQLCQVLSAYLNPRLDSDQKLRMLRNRPPRFFRSRQQAMTLEILLYSRDMSYRATRTVTSPLLRSVVACRFVVLAPSPSFLLLGHNGERLPISRTLLYLVLFFSVEGVNETIKQTNERTNVLSFVLDRFCQPTRGRKILARSCFRVCVWADTAQTATVGTPPSRYP